MKRTLAAIALLTLALAPAALADEPRPAVPAQYRWNVSDMYPDRAAFTTARAALEKRVPELESYKGHLGDSPASLLKALRARDEVMLSLGRILSYAQCLHDEDLRNADAETMSGEADKTANTIGTALSFYNAEILALGADKVAAFIKAEPALGLYRQRLDDIVRMRSHTLTAEEERLYARCSDMAGASQNTRSTFVNAELPYPEITLADGQKVRLDAPGFEKVRIMPNRDDRFKAFREYFGTYFRFRRTLGSLLFNTLKAHTVNRDVRHYSSSMAAALDSSNVPTTVYGHLLTDVHANLATLHRYLRLRQRILNVPQLRYEDLYAPLVKAVEMKYTPEQAMALTLRAAEPLGPEYTSALKKGFESRWIDWFPAPGKRSGAYMQDVYGVHPYMLLNYLGGYNDVSTLAHEAGHAMHSWLTDKHQAFPNSDYSIFVAEVASTLNENLLFHRMLDEAKDDETRLFLLGQRLESFRTTFFRQAMFGEFEAKIHERVDAGDTLTGDALDKIYLDLVRTYYGHDKGFCSVDELFGIEWAAVPHFYYDFYVYQYATSLMASTAIADKIVTEKGTTQARDAYLRFLSSGSSAYPLDLLKAAGVDMTSSAPFKSSMREMNAIMDQIEAILKKQGH